MSNANLRFGPFHGRVIKDICSNLFLHKIKELRPQIPIIYIVRHPCAVVYSRLAKKEWSTGWGWHSHLFNDQSEYINRYFHGKKIIPNNELEDHAISYCHENYLPLKAFQPQIGFHLCYYENLVLNKEVEMARICSYIERTMGRLRTAQNPIQLEDVYVTMNSKNVKYLAENKTEYINRWKKKLSEDEIRKITDIIKKFGLEDVCDKIETITG